MTSLSLVVRGGTVYDGTGAPGRVADVLVAGDRVAGVGCPGPGVPAAPAAPVLDATGLAVVPGFVNILSHAWPAMLVDGTAESELRQGVTTQVFGEADSPGPADRAYGDYLRDVYDAPVPAGFRRLGDGLDALVAGGVSPNVASFVGGANLRYLGAGFADRPLAPAELDRVRQVLAEELADGALGLGTALIYPPGRYADTAELAAVCQVVAGHDGLYISHLRSEAEGFLDALDELLELHRRTGVRAEVYHLKAAGRANWPKLRPAGPWPRWPPTSAAPTPPTGCWRSRPGTRGCRRRTSSSIRPTWSWGWRRTGCASARTPPPTRPRRPGRSAPPTRVPTAASPGSSATTAATAACSRSPRRSAGSPACRRTGSGCRAAARPAAPAERKRWIGHQLGRRDVGAAANARHRRMPGT